MPTAAAIGSNAIVGTDIADLWHRPDFIKNCAYNALDVVISIAVVADRRRRSGITRTKALLTVTLLSDRSWRLGRKTRRDR